MKRIILLFLLLLTLFLYNYSKFEYDVVSRVIDGDTIELVSGEKIRLYGINTPESDEYYYFEATDYLKSIIEHKKIKYKSYGKDQYNRLLAIVYYSDENINLKLIEEGYATPFLMSKDSDFNLYYSAFDRCIEKDVGLCKKSLDSCAPCIKLKNLNYDAIGDDRENVNGEFFILENICNYNCNLNGWIVKDSTSKNRFRLSDIIIPNNSDMVFYSGSGDNTLNSYFLCSTKTCSPVWNNDFDSFYLRSPDGGLVIYYNYCS